MSKRKNGAEIINIPQPRHPELAYFKDGQMVYIVPRLLDSGEVEYDVSKLGPEAELLVDQAVVSKLRGDQVREVMVKRPDVRPVPIRARDK